ncbi:MAG: hypothetical protein KBE22_03200 [Candidatus Accumulibacter sp.]|nr:hypothetical protein [Accumulibacter sp.]
MMDYPSLKIGGISLSIVGWLDYDQNIDPVGGSSFLRMANGAGYKLSHWRKYKISISAGGWIPPALFGVNYDAPLTLELPLPIGLNAAETLPPGWTARSAPWTETTVTDQAGNSIRMVYVKMDVLAEPPRQSNGNNGDKSWEMSFEQI